MEGEKLSKKSRTTGREMNQFTSTYSLGASTHTEIWHDTGDLVHQFRASPCPIKSVQAVNFFLYFPFSSSVLSVSLNLMGLCVCVCRPKRNPHHLERQTLSTIKWDNVTNGLKCSSFVHRRKQHAKDPTCSVRGILSLDLRHPERQERSRPQGSGNKWCALNRCQNVSQRHNQCDIFSGGSRLSNLDKKLILRFIQLCQLRSRAWFCLCFLFCFVFTWLDFILFIPFYFSFIFANSQKPVKSF